MSLGEAPSLSIVGEDTKGGGSPHYYYMHAWEKMAEIERYGLQDVRHRTDITSRDATSQPMWLLETNLPVESGTFGNGLLHEPGQSVPEAYITRCKRK